jgi:hypothetical protein
MNKIIVTAILLFCAPALATEKIGCRTSGQVDGWTGSETHDYVYFNAETLNGTELLNARVTGAYESDSRALKVDQKYKSRSARYANYNRYNVLEDAWNWFAPLLPKDFLSETGEFTAYLQVMGEEGYRGTLKLRCQLQ